MDCLFEKNAAGLWQCQAPKHGYVWEPSAGMPYPEDPPHMNCPVPMEEVIAAWVAESPGISATRILVKYRSCCARRVQAAIEAALAAGKIFDRDGFLFLPDSE